MDAYDLPHACRDIRNFVEDYSTWYVRRSRERVKQEGKDKQYALATQREVLLALAKLVAPVTPFVAESIFRAIDKELPSVHLCSWPERTSFEANPLLLEEMVQVRLFASRALEAREKAGIKIRQPLQTLTVRQELAPEMRRVLSEEVNVKEIAYNPALPELVELDATITPQLREEGLLRELIRQVQEMRKERGLTISDRPRFSLALDAQRAAIARKYGAEIAAATNLESLEVNDA
jgi:isoleucyl-tRNA synthetase